MLVKSFTLGSSLSRMAQLPLSAPSSGASFLSKYALSRSPSVSRTETSSDSRSGWSSRNSPKLEPAYAPDTAPTRADAATMASEMSETAALAKNAPSFM